MPGQIPLTDPRIGLEIRSYIEKNAVPTICQGWEKKNHSPDCQSKGDVLIQTGSRFALCKPCQRHYAEIAKRLRREEAGENAKRNDGLKTGPGIEFPDLKTDRDFNWRKATEVCCAVQKLATDAETTQREATVWIKTDDPIAVVFSSDWHFGSLAMSYAEWRAAIDFILTTPGVYVATVGDLIENTVSFKNLAHVWEQVVSPALQRKAIGSLLRELADAGKILGGWFGNHDDERDERLIGQSLIAPEFARIKRPYFSVAGDMRLKVGKVKPAEYVISGLHKARFNSYLNETHSAGQTHRIYKPHADVVVTAHTHAPAMHWCYRPDASGAEKPVVFVRTGTYKTGWLGDNLSARYYRPGLLGAPTLVFTPLSKSITPFYDAESATVFSRGFERAAK